MEDMPGMDNSKDIQSLGLVSAMLLLQGLLKSQAPDLDLVLQSRIPAGQNQIRVFRIQVFQIRDELDGL